MLACDYTGLANITLYRNVVLEPAFPTFPDTFQTRVEATIVDKKMTVSAQEYFDNRNNRATLIMTADGNTPDTLVYDYAHDQLFYIHGNFILIAKQNRPIIC